MVENARHIKSSWTIKSQIAKILNTVQINQLIDTSVKEIVLTILGLIKPFALGVGSSNSGVKLGLRWVEES